MVIIHTMIGKYIFENSIVVVVGRLMSKPLTRKQNIYKRVFYCGTQKSIWADIPLLYPWKQKKNGHTFISIISGLMRKHKWFEKTYF